MRLHLPVAPRTIVAASAFALTAAVALSGSRSVRAQGFSLPYNYLPSADITDGHFLAQAGTKLETIVGVGSDYEIYLDAAQIQDGSWQLGIFDGDTGKDEAGIVTASFNSGHWDWIKVMPTGGNEQLTYQLFEDPLGTVDPLTATPVCTFVGNDPTSSYSCPGDYASTTYSSASGMPDNEWFDITLPVIATQYRLHVKFATPEVSVESAFRLRSSGTVTTVAGRPFQLLGAARRRLDYGVLYPDWNVDTYPGTPVLLPTTYNGEWSVFVELEAGEDRLDIWDGDLDHGSSDATFPDTDDPDTLPSDIPPGGPYGDQANPEGAVGRGAPADDLIGATQSRWRRSPAIEYTVYDPYGEAYSNTNPSGNREWEKFTICEVCSDYDLVATDLPAGLYEIRIQGYDLDNINALLLAQDSYVVVKSGDAALGNTVWYDTDNDGFKDPGEAGIAGVTVTVTLDVNQNGVADPGEPQFTDVTDSSGLYLVENLPDGQYVVVPSGGPGTPLEGYDLATTDDAHQADDPANDQWSKDQPYVARISDQTDNLTADFGYIAEEPACPPSSNGSNFNGTPIAPGSTIWFNSVFNPTNLPAGGGTVHLRASVIEIVSGANTYFVNVPNADINFTSATTVGTTTTTFDTGTNKWITEVPIGYTGSIFLSGVGWVPPSGLPGGANPVTWTGQFTTNMSGMGMSWKWAAAVYTTFGTHDALGVKPINVGTNQYPNSHHAGTPENFTAYVTGGARGGGGSNFTGSYSGTKVPTICGNITIKDGDYCTHRPGEWFSAADGLPATLLRDRWPDIGASLVLGTEDGGGSLHDATWTSVTALQQWLPLDPSEAFTQDYDDATLTTGGPLAHHVGALAVNLALSEAGFTGSGSGALGDVYYCNGAGDSLSGETLSGVWSAANTALGGGGLPSGYTFETLRTLIRGLNREAVYACTFAGAYSDNLSLHPCK